MSIICILVGGPQDGAMVKDVGGELPLTVFVGPKWLGDGYAAWSRKPSKRFPAEYAKGEGEKRLTFRKYHAPGTAAGPAAEE